MFLLGSVALHEVPFPSTLGGRDVDVKARGGVTPMLRTAAIRVPRPIGVQVHASVDDVCLHRYPTALRRFRLRWRLSRDNSHRVKAALGGHQNPIAPDQQFDELLVGIARGTRRPNYRTTGRDAIGAEASELRARPEPDPTLGKEGLELGFRERILSQRNGEPLPQGGIGFLASEVLHRIGSKSGQGRRFASLTSDVELRLHERVGRSLGAGGHSRTSTQEKSQGSPPLGATRPQTLSVHWLVPLYFRFQDVKGRKDNIIADMSKSGTIITICFTKNQVHGIEKGPA